MTPVRWVPFDDRQRAKVSRGPHRFTGRVLHWPYCVRCGLVRLKNDATRRAERALCETLEDDN